MLTLSAHWITPASVGEPKPEDRFLVLPVGELWDVVRTPTSLGEPVLRRLLGRPADADLLGPVLLDDRGGWMYWLISQGSTDDYPAPAVLLTGRSWIVAPLPLLHRAYRARWRYLPSQRIVSPAAWLAAALNNQREQFGVAA
jgi:hypothetical protein